MIRVYSRRRLVLLFQNHVEDVMNSDVFARVIRLFLEGASLFLHILSLIWGWSFGQMVKMFQLPFETLPIWKQVLYVIAIIAIVYLLFRIVTRVMESVIGIGRAFGHLGSTILERIPDVLVAGLVALACAWIITNLNFDTNELLTSLHLGK